MKITQSSLLPPSHALAPIEMVEHAVLREAERGERLVSWMRAALTTTSLALLTFDLGIPALRGDSSAVAGQGWVPMLLVPSVIMAWLWIILITRVTYRPLFGRLSAVIDVVLVVLFMAGEVEIRRSPTAEIVGLGGLPPLMALMFMLAAGGVRQDLWACVISGSVSIVGVALVVIRAQHLVPLSTVSPPGLASYGAVGPWIGRGSIFAFTTAMVALAARNGRRMARATGLAVAEQDKITQVFGRYVDPEIARDVMAHEGTKGDVREVSVLFTDLRDFTAMSERMEPQEVLEALNEHYAAIVPVVHRHGGSVNKFIGDAIMATFGAPLRHADHAVRAVHAAREMHEAMRTLNASRERRQLPVLRMGIGIATGPVVVGTLGTDDRVEYAVIGDTVNTASRLEGLCKSLETDLVISAPTCEAAGDAMVFRSLGEAPVKGKSGLVAVFTVA